MKLFKKLVLMLLTTIPLPAVSQVAQSKLISLEGDQLKAEANSWERRLRLKNLLFPDYVLDSSLSSAYERFKEQSKIVENEKALPLFNNLITSMIAEGLIEVNDTNLRSATPSKGN